MTGCDTGAGGMGGLRRSDGMRGYAEYAGCVKQRGSIVSERVGWSFEGGVIGCMSD
jgi:hypothetical protein